MGSGHLDHRTVVLGRFEHRRGQPAGPELAPHLGLVGGVDGDRVVCVRRPLERPLPSGLVGCDPRVHDDGYPVYRQHEGQAVRLGMCRQLRGTRPADIEDGVQAFIWPNDDVPRFAEHSKTLPLSRLDTEGSEPRSAYRPGVAEARNVSVGQQQGCEPSSHSLDCLIEPGHRRTFGCLEKRRHIDEVAQDLRVVRGRQLEVPTIGKDLSPELLLKATPAKVNQFIVAKEHAECDRSLQVFHKVVAADIQLEVCGHKSGVESKVVDEGFLEVGAGDERAEKVAHHPGPKRYDVGRPLIPAAERCTRLPVSP